MLVLSRRLHEQVVIDGDIVITVIRIERDRIRLGIQAPRNVSIMRSELLPEEDRPCQPPNSTTKT